MPTGVGVIDTAIGGIPCGGITEIVGPALCSAGRKSLQAQLLAGATREQFCALVDATDSFDPQVCSDRRRQPRSSFMDTRRRSRRENLGAGIQSLGPVAPGERRVWTHHGRSRGNI